MAKNEATDGGASDVQRRVDETNEDGFVGTKVDPTPNRNYSVDGVTSDKPTPETDAKQRAKARESAGFGG